MNIENACSWDVLVGESDLVEHHDVRSFEYGPRDGHPLFFSPA